MGDICNLCGKGATLMCQRCKETYCSTNCQILDWRVHKNICYQMPSLVPIKECGSRDGNTAFNRSIGSDSARSRTPNDNNNTKRPLARNPLRIPADESAPNQVPNGKSVEGSSNKRLPDIDFTLKPKEAIKENEMKSNMSQCSKISTRNAPWRTPYHNPEGVFFDVIVQYVEEGNTSGIVWVTALKYDGPLRKLLAEINRNIDVNTERCSSSEIQVGSLIAAPFENLYYRAEIIEVIQISKMVVVHLIDYGNLVEVPFKALRSPIPIMRNLNSYAFRIRYANKVALESVLTIRIVNIEPNGVAKIEEKKTTLNEVPIGVAAETFTTSPTATLVKVSNKGKYALLCLSNKTVKDQLQDMNKFLNTDEEATKLTLKKPPKEGDYLAALTLNSWSRALLISTYRKDYLVYLFDVGRMSLVEKVLLVPDKFKSIPMQVFAIELQKVLSEGNNFTDCLVHNEVFAIKTQNNSKPVSDRILCYILASDGAKVAEVKAFSYLGQSEEIGLMDWIEPLISGSVVYVTSVVNHFEIFIALECTKLYPQIFTAAAEDCEPISSGKFDYKGLVLAHVESEYFRAIVLEAAKGDNVKVVNVDTGRELTVSGQTLRKPNVFVRSCPYHTRKVKLMYLSNVSTPYTDNKAREKLEQCQLKRVEFILKFDSNPIKGVELFLKTPEQQSLNKQLLPLLFEKSSNSTKERASTLAEKSEPESIMVTPPPSPKFVGKPKVDEKLKIVEKLNSKIYTLEDLEVIPITCGDNVPIMVLDTSTISKGYITACDLTNKDFMKKLEAEYLPLVAKHCASPSIHTEYCPSAKEICLAVYNADMQWYRAMCLEKLKDEMYYVLFLDYGNMCRVHKSKIKQITPELMFPANANMCIIDGLNDNVSPQVCEKFICAIQADPMLIAYVTQLEQDCYLLKLKTADKYV